MIPVMSWLYLLGFAGLATSWIVFAAKMRQIEAHLRSHHPLRASEFYPAPGMKADHGASARLREFLEKGGVKQLADPELDRLVSGRRIAKAFLGVSLLICVVAFFLAPK